MDIKDFLERLDGVTDAGNGQWMARCPAHDDSNPSLSVSVGEDGRILCQCFAGCSFDAICGSLGLKPADLMPDQPEKPKKRKPRRKEKLVAKYDYRDADGFLSYQICRYEPKTFKVRVPSPGSKYGWEWGFKRWNREPLLYHLQDVITAAKAGRVVFVVEGEKDADALIGLGVTATTAPFGADRPWLDSFTAALKGARLVVICSDNDPETKGEETAFWRGQRRAWRIGRQMEDAGLKVVRMVFPGEGVKDAADWIKAGGTKDGLVQLVRDWSRGDAGCVWPKEWEFEDASEDLLSGGKTTSAPSPTGSSETYKLTKSRSVEIDVDPSYDLRGSIEYWQFEAWKVLKEEAEDGEKTRDLTRQDRLEITSIVVIQWLTRKGKLFWNDEDRSFSTSLYFNSSGELMLISSDLFQAWLASESGMNLSTPLFKYVLAAIDQAAMNPKYSSGTIPAVMCDRRGQSLYLSNGDSQLVRIRSGKIELLPNGTDDVVFLKGKTLRKWDLLDSPGSDPFEESELFKSCSFESPHGRMLTRLWVLSIFACLRSKPVICFTGKFQTGKTRTAKGVCELLGAKERVTTIRNNSNGEKDFWVSVSNGGLICFDNVDARVDWFPDAMQAASTGAGTELKKLYKDNEVVELQARANIMLTSNTPQFATESGLSDRLVIIRLAKTRKKSSDRGLSDDFLRRHDETMTWISRTLAKAMMDEGEVEQGVNLRHPDFAEFAMRCGRALGLYDAAVSALRSGEWDKSLFPIQNDWVGREILETLCLIGIREKEAGWEGTSADLSKEILDRVGENEQTKKDFGARRIGKALDRFGDEFGAILHLYRTGRTQQRAIVYHMKGESGEFYTKFLMAFSGEKYSSELSEETHFEAENVEKSDDYKDLEEILLDGGAF